MHDHRPVLVRKSDPIDVPKYGFQGPFAVNAASSQGVGAGPSGGKMDPDLGMTGRMSIAGQGASVEVYRLVLWPSDETLWVDLRLMDTREGKDWSDEDAMVVEAQILVRSPFF